MDTLVLALVWAGAYLVGAIPFGYLVGRWRGVDIFQAGSGNIGATNVGRVLGKKFGLLVFVLDIAKGALPVAGALVLKTGLGPSDLYERGWLEVGAGLAAFLGHLFPLYLRFRGGKGVATGAGVALVLLPVPALGALLAWVTVVAATRYVSLASLAAAVVLAALHLAAAGTVDVTEPRTLFCLLAVVLVFVRHRGNIARLLAGKENQIRGDGSMRQIGKVLHVLALGLWFGSAIFFTFVAAPSLFGTFQELGRKKAENRPDWFLMTTTYDKADAEIDGRKEQGSRAAGYAVGPLFHWYFLLQGACGFIAIGTALGWTRTQPGGKLHKLRVTVLLLALVLVLAGWPLVRKVADLREARNNATDGYLHTDAPPTALEEMKAAREEFDRWHGYSMLLNLGTVILVTAAMALAAKLPVDSETIEARSA